MQRDIWLIIAGAFALLMGLWSMHFYGSYAEIWSFAAVVAVAGLVSLAAGALQKSGVY